MHLERTTAADLPKLATCAAEFYASSQFLRGFDMERFAGLWTQLLESGAGAIFSLVEDGNILGTIGGVAYREPYSGEWIATEFFWFVLPGSRGGGLKLYRAFESWAREKRCSQIRMVHLLDSMPEKLERVYRHLGFQPAEVHYTKDLNEGVRP